jgi:uncharacterized protein (DUF697 family)
MLTSGAQKKFNRIVPEKVHAVITTAFKHTVNALLKGSQFISGKVLEEGTLSAREKRVNQRIDFYKTASAAEGAITGAGGILLGLADFPLWLTLKMKMLSELALLYGYDIADYKERLYILYVFQLAFSSRKHRRNTYGIVANWEDFSKTLPPPEQFDWRSFQQEYRDHIDLAKLLQLVPGIGAFVGAYVNNKYTEKLGRTAMNAYRMRWFNDKLLLQKARR